MAARSAAAELKQCSVIRVLPGGVRTPLVEAILNSKETSPTVETFKQLDSDGKLANAADIGLFISNVLVHATEDQLSARELWDFSRSEDHI